MNRHVIIGWLGGNSEVFLNYDMKKGAQVARELKKSTAWIPIYSGSLIDLITLIKKAVKLKRLKEEVAAYMREKGMDSWWNQETIELIEIGWKRVEKAGG